MELSHPIASIIIPTYNESENILILLDRLKEVLSEIEFEIIVVDDNSPDKTWELVEEYSRYNPGIRSIRRIDDRGLSSAVVTGMEIGAGDVFVVMDADLQHDEAIIPDLIKAITEENYDVAIGSRGIEGGSYGEWSHKRRFVSWVAAAMARTVLPRSIKDPMSGFFAVSRNLFISQADSLNPRGFKILLEFIARNKNVKIKEVGYTFRNRIHGETKLSGSVIRNYLIALYDLKFGKYLSSTFFMYALVGISGIFVNMFGFAIGEYFIKLPHVMTGISDKIDPIYLSVPFGIQLSIITNYVLNNYITFFEIRHSGNKLLKGIIFFELISLFGLFIQFGVFQTLHTNGLFEGSMNEELRKFANNMIGIIAATATNYYLNLNITWKKLG